MASTPFNYNSSSVGSNSGFGAGGSKNGVVFNFGSSSGGAVGGKKNGAGGFNFGVGGVGHADVTKYCGGTCCNGRMKPRKCCNGCCTGRFKGNCGGRAYQWGPKQNNGQ